MIRLVRARAARALAGLAVATVALGTVVVAPAQAANYVPISGAGST